MIDIDAPLSVHHILRYDDLLLCYVCEISNQSAVQNAFRGL